MVISSQRFQALSGLLVISSGCHQYVLVLTITTQPLAAFLSHWVITWQEALPDMSDSILLSTRQQRPPFHPWIVTGAEHLFSFLSAAAPGFMLIGEL